MKQPFFQHVEITSFADSFNGSFEITNSDRKSGLDKCFRMDRTDKSNCKDR